jgi:heterogeneous nuclear ribonucleoprotein L
MLVGQQEGCVLMVYNMVPNRMNCEKLFNLFCLYGNVAKVKFLKSKEGSAMVQMGDHMAVTHVVSNLRNLTVFGNPLQLQYSKQAFLTEQAKPQDLPDGTSSFQNFTNSKNNRFVHNDAKNRIQAPCKMLHFFNCPPNVSESELREIFTSCGVDAPIDVKIFQKREEGARVCGGLMQFETQSAAVDAIVTCNHTPITAETSKYPYILKLCFSTTRADKIMRDSDME